MKLIMYLVFALLIFSQTIILTAQTAYDSSLVQAADSNKNIFTQEDFNLQTQNKYSSKCFKSNKYSIELSLNNSKKVLSAELSGYENIYSSKKNLIPETMFDKNNESSQSAEKGKSFLNKNLIYFLGAAAVAVTAYLVLHKKESPSNSNTTFGMPPLPH